ncbi:hypothetical protein G6662_05930 [Polynucleobacter paneuropaeus]|nr:hypothetical protein [Polynucleobacter paneuropaeus]
MTVYEMLILVMLASTALYIIHSKGVYINWFKNKKIIYLFIFVFVFVSFYLFWAIRYNSVQTGDFGVYWKCGADFRLPINSWLEICRGAYLKNPLVYAMRSLFFNVPISWATAYNYQLWKLAMALLHITTVFFVYKIFNNISGTNSGIPAAFLLFINPEWIYLITSSSADNIILLVQICSFLIFYRFSTERKKNDFIKFFPAFIIIFFLSEWLRSIGILVFITFLLSPQKFGSKGLLVKKTAILCASFVAANLLTSFIIREMWLVQYISPLTFISSLAEIDLSIRPPQNPQISFEWMNHLWIAIDPGSRNSIGLHRFIDEMLTQYSQFPIYYFQKIALLFAGSGNMDMLTNISPGNIDNVFTTQVSTLPSGAIAHKAALYSNIFILSMALYSILFIRYSSFEIISLTFIAVFMFILGGFGPLLSRYGLLMAFPLAALGAASKENFSYANSKYSAQLLKVAGSCTVIVFTYLFGGILASTYTNHYPRIILSATQPSASHFPEVGPCNNVRVPIHMYFDRRMRSNFESNVTCASYLFPIKPNTASISFFITREKLPFPNENIGRAQFEYSTRIGDLFSPWESLDKSASKWMHFQIDVKSTIQPKNIEIFIRKIGEESTIEFEIRDFLYD